jgi:hypothetical protein
MFVLNILRSPSDEEGGEEISRIIKIDTRNELIASINDALFGIDDVGFANEVETFFDDQRSRSIGRIFFNIPGGGKIKIDVEKEN